MTKTSNIEEMIRSTSTRPAVGGAQDIFRAAMDQIPLPLFVRAEGVHLWDDKGREYIDVSSGPVVSNIGHGNDKVGSAISAQLRSLDFLSSRQGRSQANIDLSEKIAQLAGRGYERVCLSSGGSEANEIAIKFLRQYCIATGQSSRTMLVSCMPSYHGSTVLTLGLSGNSDSKKFLDGFGPTSLKIPAPLTYRLPAGKSAEQHALDCADALETAIVAAGPKTVLAFVVEPIGGLASGCAIPPKSYFRRVREICDRYGVFLVFDEVLCGSGRTGYFLASRHVADVNADVLVLAKGLGAGYVPLGATLASAKMVDSLAELTGFGYMHTYSANPIACAAGLAVLKEVEDRDLMRAARDNGGFILSELRKLKESSKIIGDVRGTGLLMAVELVADKQTKTPFPPARKVLDLLLTRALENGLVIYARRTSGGSYGEWFMVSPPLTITREESVLLLKRLARTIASVENDLLGTSSLVEA